MKALPVSVPLFAHVRVVNAFLGCDHPPQESQPGVVLHSTGYQKQAWNQDAARAD